MLLLIGAERVAADSMTQNGEVHLETEVIAGESLERSFESSDHIRTQQTSDPVGAKQVGKQTNFIDATYLASWIKEFIEKLGSLRSQNHISVLAVMVFAVIFLMQVRTFLPVYFCYII